MGGGETETRLVAVLEGKNKNMCIGDVAVDHAGRGDGRIGCIIGGPRLPACVPALFIFFAKCTVQSVCRVVLCIIPHSSHPELRIFFFDSWFRENGRRFAKSWIVL